MLQLLIIKEKLQKFYQRYVHVLNPLFRFFAGFITFFAVNRVIGYNPVLNKTYIEIVASCVSMVFPFQVLLFMASVYVVLQILYISKYLALATGIILAVIYFLYVRFLPKHGFIIMAMPILYAFNIPYALPILMGIASTPISIIPIGFGILIYFLIENVISVISISTEDSITLYNMVVQQLFSEEQFYVTVIVFAIVTVIVYIIRNTVMKYSFEIAVFSGSISMIILFLITNYMLDSSIDIVKLTMSVLVSTILVYIVQFFRLSLNYAGTENLQFEDEEYYYYVRAVPKTNISATSKKVKHFNAHHVNNDEEPADGTEVKAEPEHDFDFKVSLDKEDFEDIKED